MAEKYMVTRLGFDLGFAPDVDWSTPGACQGVMNMIPCNRGLRTLPIALPRGGTFADTGTVTGSATVAQICGYGYQQIIAGRLNWKEWVATQDHIYVSSYSGSTPITWSDVSRSTAYAFSAVCWSFEEVGEAVMIAAPFMDLGTLMGGAIPLQKLSATAAAEDIVGSPTCGVLTSADRFVLAFNGRGGFNDSWNCCARDDYTSWTTSAATLAAGGRLVDPPGAIVCAISTGKEVLAFKQNAVIRGRFVRGSAEVWEWERLPYEAGAAGPRSACRLPDGRVAFVGPSGCYLYDGATIRSVLNGRASEWFCENVVPPYFDMKFSACYSSVNDSVWFGVPVSAAGGGIDPGQAAIVMHVPSGRLGYVKINADLLAEMPRGNQPVPAIGFIDNVYRKPWAFDEITAGGLPHTHSITSLVMSNLEYPNVTSGDLGDPYLNVEVGSIVLDAPVVGSGTLSGMMMARESRQLSGERTASATTSDASQLRFDVRTQGHWLRARFTFGAYAETNGVWIEHTPTGRRK